MSKDGFKAEMRGARSRLLELETLSRAIEMRIATLHHDHVSVRSALLLVLDDLDRVELAIQTLAATTADAAQSESGGGG